MAMITRPHGHDLQGSWQRGKTARKSDRCMTTQSHQAESSVE